MTPYYDEDGVTIYHGDCREVGEWQTGDVLVTDPPYGINYESGWDDALPGIAGDGDTALRDWVLTRWVDPKPWAVFGSWKRPRPAGLKAVLIWEKGEHSGMGDLSFPWRLNWEEVYIGGKGWAGRRDSGVLRVNAPVTWNAHTYSPRKHPHEKPATLIRLLLEKVQIGTVVDPFMGSGTTLRAAKDLGRKAIGIEIDERYCEIAVQRLAQSVLAL